MSTITIYKIDSLGNERYLEITASEDGFLIQNSGIVGTDSPVSHKKLCKPKNVGKTNETSSFQQASLEAASRVRAKLDGGYFTSLKEAVETPVVLPMLAKSYEDHKGKIDWSGDVFAQPKLDGMRAITLNSNLISRKGKLIKTLEHIRKELPAGVILDGELYSHGESFQKNMKIIKKYRPGATEKVKYRVYDIVDENKSYAQRLKILTGIVRNSQTKNIEVVEAYKINSEEELIQYHEKFLSAGYEGTIVRWGDAPYKINGRSASLLKYKNFKDIAVPIVDVIPAEQRSSWGVPVLELPDGRRFKAGTRLSHADRQDLLENKQKYIGSTAEIRFFEYSTEGVPRFPVFVGIRLDK